DDPNQLLLFSDYQLNEKSVENIEKIINQYCFSTDKVENLKPHIIRGQKNKVSPDLLTLNTYVNNGYETQFESNMILKNSILYENSKYDDLFVNESNNKMFSVKLLHIYYEGSFYEYRN